MIKRPIFWGCAAAFVVLLFACAALPPETPPGKGETVSQAEPIPEKKPASAAVRFAEQVQVTLEQEGVKDALAFFDHLPEELTGDTGLIILQASLYFSDRQHDRAAEILDAFLVDQPDNDDALVLRAMVAGGMGDQTARQKIINKLLGTNRNHPRANIMAAEDQVLHHRYRDAQGFYQRALQGEPENIDALLGLGQMAYYLRNDQDSSRAFNEILRIQPKNGDALSYLAKLEAEKGQYRRAQEYIEQAIALDSGQSDFWNNYGLYLHHLGNYDRAIFAWKKAADLDPSSFLTYVYLGGMYDQLGDIDAAYESYRTALKLNARYYFVWAPIGVIAWQKEHWKESREAFTQAYQGDSANVSYLLLIAACYLKEGMVRESRSFLTKAMRPLDKQSLEYAMVRFYFDSVENGLSQKVLGETNRTLRGKMLYYLGLFHDIQGERLLAEKYYRQVRNMEHPGFFEYRMSTWALESIASTGGTSLEELQ
ncbi:MAG: tetratricopeptide repeat protein [Spirochaetaceae bacterium]|nr:tetratricopeptide repeat protein [Spirochaetaceae bacterium]